MCHIKKYKKNSIKIENIRYISMIYISVIYIEPTLDAVLFGV